MAGKTVFKKQVRVTRNKARKSTKAKPLVFQRPSPCKAKRRGAFAKMIVSVKVSLETAEGVSGVVADICEEKGELTNCAKPMG